MRLGVGRKIILGGGRIIIMYIDLPPPPSFHYIFRLCRESPFLGDLFLGRKEEGLGALLKIHGLEKWLLSLPWAANKEDQVFLRMQQAKPSSSSSFCLHIPKSEFQQFMDNCFLLSVLDKILSNTGYVLTREMAWESE